MGFLPHLRRGPEGLYIQKVSFYKGGRGDLRKLNLLAPEGSGASTRRFAFLFSFFDLQFFLVGRFHVEASAFELLEQTFLDQLAF